MPSTSKISARFRPVADVAYVTQRSHRTIRNWARDGRIERRTDPRTGTLLVDLVAADALSKQAGRRNRQPATTAA